MKFSFLSYGLLTCGVLAVPLISDGSTVTAREDSSSFQGAEKRGEGLSEFAQVNQEWLKPAVDLLVNIISHDSEITHTERDVYGGEEKHLRRFGNAIEGPTSSKRDKTRISRDSVEDHQTLEKKSEKDGLREQALDVLRHLLTVPPFSAPRSPHIGKGGTGGPGLPQGTGPTAIDPPNGKMQ